MATWRAQSGPNREVFFPQVHEPGLAAQSDFTHMTSLGVTLGGVPFEHLVFHLVFVYSNVEAVRICFSETFEALAEGFETCLWQLGGAPRQHRTDHLSAALRPLGGEERAAATERYAALLRHYGVEATANNAGEAHENGDDLRQRGALVAHTIYACSQCDERFVGVRRCPECNLFLRPVGLGGTCPECDSPILLADLLDLEVLP